MFVKKYFQKQFWHENPRARKVLGVSLVIAGLLSVITPFTPAGFLLIIGLEILGVRALFWEKLKNWFKKSETNS